MDETGLEAKGTISSNAPATPLAAKLQEHVRQSGTLSSSDVASFVRAQPEAKEAKPTPGAAMQEVTVVEEPKAQLDPMVERASSPETPGQRMSSLQDALATTATTIKQQEDRKLKVVVTPADKEAFIAAIIRDGRLELTLPRCGDSIPVAVRSRTVLESQAILAYIQRQLVGGKIVTQMDYVTHLRAAMLSAQIKNFNGKDYPALTTPLLPVQDIVNNTTTPAGWEAGVSFWIGMGEAPFALLWSCVEEFEGKYWRMIEDSRDQNFWNPAASI